MYERDEPVCEATETPNGSHYSSEVDYSGNNWVSWLTARLIQYTGILHECEGIPFPHEDLSDEELEEYDGEMPRELLPKRRKMKRRRRNELTLTQRAIDAISKERINELNDKFYFNNLAVEMYPHLLCSLDIEPEDWIVSKSQILNIQRLEEVIDEKERQLRPYKHVRNFPAIKNAKKLGKLLGLPDTATELLSAIVAAKTGADLLFYMLGDVARWENGTSVIDMAKKVFKLSDAKIAELRNPEGKVRITQVPGIDWKARGGYALDTSILGHSHVEDWGIKVLTTKQLTARFFNTEAPSRLRVEPNYDYMKDQAKLIVDYLREASKQNKKGTNVFLYGPPGTGKTQLARAAAKAAGLRLYNTRNTDEEDSYEFGKYHTAQILLDSTKSGCCLLMDESEDFFNRAEFSGPKDSGGHKLSKYRLNATFEDNPIPAIWISNSLHRIDPAHLRRFGVVIEVPVPPRRVRASIFRKYTGGLRLSQPWIDDAAQNADITPADIESAANVVKTAGNRRGKAAEKEMRAVLKEKLKVRGAKMGRKPKMETRYDLSLSNADMPLEPIVRGLAKTGEGRVLLYGPPGTGKTAFARHVADIIGKPLMANKASDLLSMWVGENEKNIANMFERARLDDAVLLLDEADSFLQDRSDAHRSWEITIVNEMLVQMEHFHGVFLCSSNLMDRLDQATFRRFDIKIKFEWMRASQKLRMLEQLTQKEPSEKEVRQLANLSMLTPGDFAAIARRFRVLQEDSPSVSRVIAELEEEARFKKGSSRQAGFKA